MAAPFFTTTFQPYFYQNPRDAVIPFQILGGEAQVVQIMLKSQEKVIARPGSMCFMSGAIKMDNTYAPENELGLWQWLFGKNIACIILRNPGPSDGFVRIVAPSLSRILSIDFGHSWWRDLVPDVFLCSINDVKVSNTFDRRVRNVVAGAEENLDVGEVLAVDVSCIAAMTSTVNIQIKSNGPLRRALFGQSRYGSSSRSRSLGSFLLVRPSVHPFVIFTIMISILLGDNLVTATLTGPGIVFIQSLPFQRFSRRLARAVTSPNMSENPKFFIQMAIFFFLAYVLILSSLIITDA